MKKFWIVFLVIAVLVGGGFGLLWMSLSQMGQTVAIDGGALIWHVGGAFPEETDDSFVGQLQGGAETTLGETVIALRRAAKDERITGLVMDMRAVETDWAKIDEIRRALAVFRESGKPIYAYFDGAGTREYALACQADKIYMSPEANLMVLGISAELSFMKDTLDKLGMEADFIHVGKYKSAPERMTRTEATAANREMIGAIVDERYEGLLGMLTAGRGVPREQAQAWVDRGMFDAVTALEDGLVDEALYFDDVLDRHFSDDQTTEFDDYVLDKPKRKESSHTVGLVYATGVIMPGESRWDRFQGKIAGSETIVEELLSMADDDDVDIVILRVDSPGGSAMASDLIWEAVGQVQKNKPLIVSMSGMAASGGYYISCRADSIFADPSTLTGSIGVYAGKMSRRGLYEKIGVHREFITRGDNALLFSDEGGFTDAQRKLFQNQMDHFYKRFLAKVAEGRGMAPDAVHAVAQGRVWTGQQALQAGLVDDLGGLYRALDSAKWSLGLIPEDPVNVVSFGEEMSPLQRMLLQSLRQGGGLARIGHRLGLDADDSLPLGAVLTSLRQDGLLAAVDLMDGRPVAMLPYGLKVR
ncbi:signal peptide peptidase SppA [bacterium DOLJORAL78_65_58]|nr:MAG: signal peptide peptidase SppA [bacterium DOLZORAL124_64_63]PIE76528.1 MAG: signal peptide peptidase SppA [bacterium DOLJORAL78_65_58]